MDLVSPGESVVDATHDGRHRIRGVERLIGIHLSGQIGIPGNLPTGEVDCLKPGLDLLHGLIAGQCAERIDKGVASQRLPEFFGTPAGE